jgi:ketosteroid isomerase-like protein
VADAQMIAAALHAALETGDTTALADRCAEDMVVWHNSDRTDLDKDAALERISAVTRVAYGVTVEVVRLAETDFGFVDQIVLRGTFRATGFRLELHNCLLVTVDGGRVERVDEYVDPNVTSQMASEIPSGNGG